MDRYDPLMEVHHPSPRLPCVKTWVGGECTVRTRSKLKRYTINIYKAHEVDAIMRKAFVKMSYCSNGFD